MNIRNVKVGTRVVFSKDKSGPSPGRRAQDVSPHAKGESYSYIVDKYWIVKEVHDDNTVTLATRRGKEHRVPLDDPRLRPANLWERLLRQSRFPTLQDAAQP